MKKAFKKVVAMIIAFSFLFYQACSCGEKNDEPADGKIENSVAVKDGFSVHFIDVGEGDAIFIRFSDGKTALIDCGELDGERNNFYAIKEFLDAYSVKDINYFVLSHVDSDHVGNASLIAENYDVETAYVPYSVKPELYPSFNSALSAFKEREIKIETSEMLKKITGEDYLLLFLLPTPAEFTDSPYDGFNGKEPSASAINDVSAVIYLEYKGIKFLFTGDAEYSPQKTVYQNAVAGYYAKAVKGFDVDLTDLDFFKVPHHGSSDAVNYDLWNYIKCKNAIISSGGDNRYGHPSDEALIALLSAREDCNILRTDSKGNISVFINDGGYEIITEVSLAA